MKKKVLGIVLLALASALPAMAQQPAPATCNNTEACTGATSGECKARKAQNPFEGLNLTDAQQKALGELCKKQCEGQRVQKEKNAEAAKQAKEAKREARRKYLDEVKAILTPEQYSTFLENNYINRAPRHGKHHKGDVAKGNRQGKACKGDISKCNRQGRKAVDQRRTQPRNPATTVQPVNAQANS